MTLTLSQDIRYPLIGDTVTLLAEGAAAGFRVRWRATAVPVGSSILMYSAQTEHWFAGNTLAADIDGRYDMEAVEEQFTGRYPHYSNDTEDAVDEWTETTATVYSVYFGKKLRRVLGVSPHQITLNLTVVASASYPQGGVLTDFFDSLLAPKLSDPTTDIASFAATSAAVVAQLATLGGAGYPWQAEVITSGNFLVSPATAFNLLTVAFDGHRVSIANAVHGATGAADLITATATGSATQAKINALLNDAAPKHNSHMNRTASIHGATDPSNVVTWIPSTYAVDYDSAIDLLHDLQTKYESHLKKVTSAIHAEPGDGISSHRLVQSVISGISTVTDVWNASVEFKTAFNAHIVTFGTTAYHMNADNDNIAPTSPVLDTQSFVSGVNSLADVIGAHCTNVKDSDKSTTPYHQHSDTGGDTVTIPRASDMATAVPLLEQVIWIYSRHIDRTSGSWHGTVNPGRWYSGDASGISKLHRMFLEAAHANDLGVPAYVIPAVQDLTGYGGFVKV